MKDPPILFSLLDVSNPFPVLLRLFLVQQYSGKVPSFAFPGFPFLAVEV
jgi:hypothetical protein